MAKAMQNAKKEKKERTFIGLTPEFVKGCREVRDAALQQAMQVSRNVIAQRVQAVKDLKPDIPRDWVFDLDRGGFVPPKER